MQDGRRDRGLNVQWPKSCKPRLGLSVTTVFASHSGRVVSVCGQFNFKQNKESLKCYFQLHGYTLVCAPAKCHNIVTRNWSTILDFCNHKARGQNTKRWEWEKTISAQTRVVTRWHHQLLKFRDWLPALYLAVYIDYINPMSPPPTTCQITHTGLVMESGPVLNQA